MVELVHRTGYLFFSGYSKYVQKVEKNKEKIYNRVEIEKAILSRNCGNKVNIII
jgi:hypothetical protein